MFHKSIVTIAAFALFIASSTSIARAAPVFADWSNGTLGGLTFTVAETEAAGFIQPSTDTATDPTFIADFADEFSTLQFQAPAGGADLFAEVTFSQALPTGAQLLAFDLDFFNEIFTIGSNLGTLNLLGQGETQTGGASDFPTYNPGSGTLTSAFATFGDNPFEYSLFDASGVTRLDLGWQNGRDSGSRIVVTIPDAPAPVPLPAGLALLGTALLFGMGMSGRHRRNM